MAKKLVVVVCIWFRFLVKRTYKILWCKPKFKVVFSAKVPKVRTKFFCVTNDTFKKKRYKSRQYLKKVCNTFVTHFFKCYITFCNTTFLEFLSKFLLKS